MSTLSTNHAKPSNDVAYSLVENTKTLPTGYLLLSTCLPKVTQWR
ncbi:hypothetical protein ACS79Z_12160 [Yersinia enterocolitica]|nr:hypothetical protein [Yersinia pekkanenii]